MTTIHELLNEYRTLSTDERNKGQFLERMVKSFLQIDPQYTELLSNVWLWDEWSDRWGSDDGIDLVAQERGTGDYWAIQCKFFDPGYSIQKADIDSFFTASGKRFATLSGERGFSRRVIVSTTEKWSSKADTALDNQTPPTFKLGLKDLEESPVDWAAFSLKRVQDIRLKTKKAPWKHQPDAIKAVVEGFQSADRGKLVMACGTGKTFTSLRLMEELIPENGRVLFLAPSISLVAQTLREWTAQATSPIHTFVVCSDTKVGKDEEDIRTSDLAYPATTDARKLASHAQAMAMANNRRTVIFSTYQSIQVVADAQKAGLDDFDLIICDEAHRTTGLTLSGEDHSEFVKVHHNHIVRGSKRLYMTATPRIYDDKSKTKANDKDAILFSMDDEATYGQEFYRLGFGDAVHKWEVLSDYKVLIVAVNEDRMAELANQYNEAIKLKQKDGKQDLIDIRLATKIIGSWKGLSKRGIVTIGDDGEQETLSEDPQPMRRAVAFSKSIKASKQMTGIFGGLVKTYLQSANDSGMVDCELDHVDGGDNALKRQRMLDWLKTNPGEGNCRILSNARCLSEGIDVPSLDAVVFFDTRESIVDIVQSVGRVMRKAEGKQYGYIILPVGIPSSKVKDYNGYISSDPQFKGIWKVIKALRAHDESLVDEAEFRSKVKVITGGDGGGGGDGRGGQLNIDFEPIPLGDLSEAVYAAIPKKLGDMEYWSEWAKSIGEVAARLTARIEALFTSSEVLAAEFDKFLKGLQDTLNPAISRTDALEMLTQHILTLPVFQALFTDSNFPANNAVGKALQAIADKLDAHAVASETEGLGKFYDNVRERISLAKSDKSKQDIIRNLYDTFFHNAFQRMAERLGIVYTPVEVVDFILHSTEFALQKHFGASLNDQGVQVLDPFTGTGTFMVRLLQSGLIKPENLPHKYAHELHANELVLLAYYIATINIETAYHAVTEAYQPFNGMVLADTFQITEDGDIVDKVVLPENNERIEHQLKQDIRVIIGNPPYSAQQDSENDNNKNINYPTLDSNIRDTYSRKSSGKLAKSSYDSYVRAIRWASNRIRDRGLIAFVTNNSFLDANNMDGLRKCLYDEYSKLYIFNLRGAVRGKSKELSKLEGGNVFDIITGVSIILMIKDKDKDKECEIYYHDIGDCFGKNEKLDIISEVSNIENISWLSIKPNDSGDWINQRDPVFDGFIKLGDKESKNTDVIFNTYSLGVVTNRDPWVCSMNKKSVEDNVKKLVDAYNIETDKYKKSCSGKKKEQFPTIERIVNSDPKYISWTRSLKSDAAKGKIIKFDDALIKKITYRPFIKQWLYFSRSLNEMVYQVPKLFPTEKHSNIVISCTGVADRKGFSAFIADLIPSLHLTDTGQCFPLYWYEKIETDTTQDEQDEQLAMFGSAENDQPDQYGYIRREAITDWALSAFRSQYHDDNISKEAIFSYVYGILHSPEYKTRFAADLKKMLPRIPFAADFRAFSDAGRKLAALHLNYETAEPYTLVEEKNGFDFDKPSFYRVQKMAFGKSGGKPDKSVIVYNGNLTLRGIPLEAYEYVVNVSGSWNATPSPRIRIAVLPTTLTSGQMTRCIS